MHGTLPIHQTVEEHFGISERTAKRDLGQICDWCLVEFYRSEQPGCYRLK